MAVARSNQVKEKCLKKNTNWDSTGQFLGSEFLLDQPIILLSFGPRSRWVRSARKRPQTWKIASESFVRSSKMRLVRGQTKFLRQNVILCGVLVGFFGFYPQTTTATDTNEIQGSLHITTVICQISVNHGWPRSFDVCHFWRNCGIVKVQLSNNKPFI